MFTVLVEVSRMLWVPGITSAPPIKLCSVYVPVLDAHIYCIMPGYILRCNFFLCWLFLPKCKRLWELIVLPLMFVAGGVMGIYEEWKPEILGCRRHISSRPVLCPHSIPSEACLCIINWSRYTIFFLVIWPFPLLGSFMNLDFHLTSFWFCILGISAALLSVMGSRFKKSGKIFPAGVVSLVSLVMVGGYFHGILRSSHAW